MDLPADLLDNLFEAQRVLSAEPAGLIADVDGTLSAIVDRPEEARVHPEVSGLLARLVVRLPLVAAVSGRSMDQLLSMLPVDSMVYVGNHGLEWWEDGRSTVVGEARPYLPAMAETMRCLRERLRGPGLLVEEKGPTGTVHYRLSPNPAEARETILQAISRCPSAREMRWSDGRMVVNLLPPVRADKGTAVERLVRGRGLRGAIYLGDDVTDLDAFRVLRSLRRSGECSALTVAVAGPEAPSALYSEADYRLDGVDAVVAFLRQMAGWLEQP